MDHHIQYIRILEEISLNYNASDQMGAARACRTLVNPQTTGLKASHPTKTRLGATLMLSDQVCSYALMLRNVYQHQLNS